MVLGEFPNKSKRSYFRLTDFPVFTFLSYLGGELNSDGGLFAHQRELEQFFVAVNDSPVRQRQIVALLIDLEDFKFRQRKLH